MIMVYMSAIQHTSRGIFFGRGGVRAVGNILAAFAGLPFKFRHRPFAQGLRDVLATCLSHRSALLPPCQGTC